MSRSIKNKSRKREITQKTMQLEKKIPPNDTPWRHAISSYCLHWWVSQAGKVSHKNHEKLCISNPIVLRSTCRISDFPRFWPQGVVLLFVNEALRCIAKCKMPFKCILPLNNLRTSYRFIYNIFIVWFQKLAEYMSTYFEQTTIQFWIRLGICQITQST